MQNEVREAVDLSRITTKQFGRSWFHAEYNGKFVVLGKTRRQAIELAVQKLSPLHVGGLKGRPRRVPAMPAEAPTDIAALASKDRADV